MDFQSVQRVTDSVLNIPSEHQMSWACWVISRLYCL